MKKKKRYAIYKDERGIMFLVPLDILAEQAVDAYDYSSLDDLNSQSAAVRVRKEVLSNKAGAAIEQFEEFLPDYLNESIDIKGKVRVRSLDL